MLNDDYTQALEEAGLKIFKTGMRMYVIKPEGLPGNRLPFGSDSLFASEYHSFITDCPRIDVFKKEGIFQALH